jgi:hypothetical protein
MAKLVVDIRTALCNTHGMGTMNDKNRASQTLAGMEVKSMTTTTPLAFLSPSDLRGLVAFFKAERAALSVNIERDGVTYVVTARDLAFIHSLDASRFGQAAGCPLCEAGQ